MWENMIRKTVKYSILTFVSVMALWFGGSAIVGRVYLATVVYPAWDNDFEIGREMVAMKDSRQKGGNMNYGIWSVTVRPHDRFMPKEGS